MKNEEQNKVIEEAAKQYAEGNTDERRLLLLAVQEAGQKWLTDAEFAEQFEGGKKIAKARDEDELSMQFIVNFATTKDTIPEEDRKKTSMVVLPDWSPEDDKQKHDMMMGLGMKLAEDFPDHMLVSIVHISEAWASTLPKDADPDDLKVMPRDDPNHTEVVVVHAMSTDQRQSFYQGEITKDADGKTVIEDRIEHIHDPKNPLPLNASETPTDRLSIWLLGGYFKARGDIKEE